MKYNYFIFGLGALIPSTLASQEDLLGPDFQPPTNVAAEMAIVSATDTVKTLLESMFLTGNTPYGNMQANDTALSVNIVSLDSDTPVLDFHHTPHSLNISAGSTSKVDRNSVYRIGSVSKLFTVYALLVNNGRKYWDTPVPDLIPELRHANGQNDSIVEYAQWDDITVGALASQMGGIGRDFHTGDLSVQGYPAAAAGLPELPPQDIPTCGGTGNQPPCSKEDFLNGFENRHPVSLPYAIATYSNVGFALLNYVIQSITKSSYEEALQNTVFKSLGMRKSSTTRPKARGAGVIPNGESTWLWDLGYETSAGGIFSSAHDLGEFGKAILGNKQLSTMETRRWMKPQAHTASLTFSVGAPWEILRTRTNITTGRRTDLYTKSGSIGLYESVVILIPDFNIAISILAAGHDASLAVTMATETTVQKFLPALEATAREQSCRKYCGMYSPSDPKINSSLVLTVDDNKTGLVVEKWISRGVDAKAAVAVLTQSRGGTFKDIVLHPMDLRAKDKTGAKESYRAVLMVVPPGYNPDVRRVVDPNASPWGTIDGLMYGGVALDDFVFHVDRNGTVNSVEPRVMRGSYHKK